MSAKARGQYQFSWSISFERYGPAKLIMFESWCSNIWYTHWLKKISANMEKISTSLKYITTSKRYGLAKKDVNQWLIYFEFCLSFAAPGWYQLHQSLLIHPCVSDIGSVFTQDSILKQGSRAKGVGFTSLILYYIDKPARWGSLYPKGTNYSSHVATA